MADHINLDEHQFFVPMTIYTRPNGTKTEINFPVIDQETVDHANKCIAAEFSYAGENLGGKMFAFYIVDDVAEYDAKTTVLHDIDGEQNRKNVSDFIKSSSVEQLLSDRERYIAQENSND